MVVLYCCCIIILLMPNNVVVRLLMMVVPATLGPGVDIIDMTWMAFSNENSNI